MLKLTIFELILIGVPEILLFILSIYIFTFTKINLKNLFLSCILYTIAVYTIRILPIQFGVHAILNLFVIILLCIKINKINGIKTIFACLVSFIILFICDQTSCFLMMLFTNNNTNSIIQNPMLKVLYSIPSLLLYFCIILIINKTINTVKEAPAKIEM